MYFLCYRLGLSRSPEVEIKSFLALHNWSLNNYRMIMNDPDRNTAPGLFFSPLKGLSKMRSSNYLVGSGFFKANYPFNYPFYFNNQDFVPAV